MNTNYSADIQEYFQQITASVKKSYDVAGKARKKGLDPEDEVPIPLAKNMAERVVSLISVVAPQVMDAKIPARIIELEIEYGSLDWRVALKIAEEVAQEKFCKFETKQEAMEVGIRMGFAYLTLGIVSAPLEGFIGLKIKKRKDGQEYFALQYAGPIRAAGGTAAATSVILADYVRIKMGYAPYDPDEQEINRYVIEIQDYHERVTNLQYFPSEEELRFMVSHLPVEVDGDPTEDIEVSNYKDLPRVETNMIRGGVCLVLAEGLTQKSPKLWKKISKWGKEMGLEWDFLSDFIKLKEKIHSSHVVGSDNKKDNKTSDNKNEPQFNNNQIISKVKPNDTFLMDLVAGRPILTHPMATGGFRLRYGRGRTCGMYAVGMHPATLIVLDKYIAIGTQLKVERPRKGASVTVCDTLEGPIVRIKDGSVLQLRSEDQAKKVNPDVEEIIFLGDILFNYGDFSESGHTLVPVGYCPEWWVQELEKALIAKFPQNTISKGAEFLYLDPERLSHILQEPLLHYPSWEESLLFTSQLQVPLHPEYLFYWQLISGEDLFNLREYLRQGKLKKENNLIHKIILSYFKDQPLHLQGKKILDSLGASHLIVTKDNLVLEEKEARIICYLFNISDQKDMDTNPWKLEVLHTYNPLIYLNTVHNNILRDKAGTFIGARMGRPEKAKMRLMLGSPQVMFPVGEEGSRLRSFASAITAGKITGDFPTFFCQKCKKNMIYPLCEECGEKCQKLYHCKECGLLEKDTCRHGKLLSFKRQEIDIAYYFNKAKDRLGEKILPELIKGVRGTSNKEHLVEHLSKGLLRAKHNIYVNKDGTTRYDCTELPLTHFKPKEVKTSVEKLKELGYNKDIYDVELTHDDQILELKPQDLVLPGYDSLDESAPRVMTRVANFIDELLVKFYGLKPFYKIKKDEDLVGHLIIGLAPHISAGLVGRIVGFSETQGLLAHPMFHAGLRRDCFVYDTMIPIFDGNRWNNFKIGELVEKLNPTKVIDNFGTKEITVQKYKTIGFDKNKKISLVKINSFTKHTPSKIIKIKTFTGRVIATTLTHKFPVNNKSTPVLFADQLRVGDILLLPKSIPLENKNYAEIDLLEVFSNRKDFVIRNIKKELDLTDNLKQISFKLDINYRDLRNYYYRDSFPLDIFEKIVLFYRLNKEKITKNAKLAAKRDTVCLPIKIALDDDFLEYLGLYVAEGYSRYNNSSKGFAQVYVAAFNEEIRDKLVDFGSKIGLKQSENKKDRITFSSRAWYELVTHYFNCGSDAYSKRVPNFLFSADKNVISPFLRGYFEGDGSVTYLTTRVTCDSVNKQLLNDIHLLLLKYGIFSRFYEYTKQPGPQVRQFYINKKREIPFFTCTKLTIPSNYVKIYAEQIGFISNRKKSVLTSISKKKVMGMRIKQDQNYIYDPIIEILEENEQAAYCLNVDNHVVLANGILTRQCDGDEACLLLLMDALLNFSRQFLPERRGAKTMDAPLVLTSLINPKEVDEQVLDLDVAWRYPLEMYEAALELKKPGEVRFGPEQKKIPQLADRLGTPLQYEGFGFTHGTDNFNKGVLCSAYKTIPSMAEKLAGQMEIARKVRAVNTDDVAKLVIQKHFLKDIKGNLKKFSMQQFRCVKCNTKYRRPPLSSKCSECGGKLIFTISEGSVIKYLIPSLVLCQNYEFSPYLKETLDILKMNVDHIFGKEKEKQAGLGEFMG